MTEKNLLRLYLAVSLLPFGWGAVLVLGDLPPFEAKGNLRGLEFYFGFITLLLPGLANLLNVRFGNRKRLLRWGILGVNGLYSILWAIITRHIAWQWFGALFFAVFMVLVSLSALLARSWSRPSEP